MPSLKHLEISKLPTTLYHCSAYSNKELLRPGIKHTGKIVEWDNGESNEYLYATTDKEEALSLGFATAIEHKYKLDRYTTKGNQITIASSDNILFKELSKLEFYLYSIQVKPEDGWIKNNNPNNQITTEWKTDQDISSFDAEKVDVHKWLKTKYITIKIEK